MRLFLTGALLVAATAAQASAQTTFMSSPGAPDPGIGLQTMLIDFNGGPYTGFSFSGSYSILSGSVSGAAAPAGILTGAGQGFFATPNVNQSATGTATIDFSTYLASSSLAGLSFYWGSIDTYNTLEVLGVGNTVLKTIVGSDVVNPANGNQTAQQQNRRLYLDFGSDAANFRALRFTSNGRAFEIDDIAGTVIDRAEVPEPATLSMLTFGIAMLGVAGARRKRLSSTI